MRFIIAITFFMTVLLGNVFGQLDGFKYQTIVRDAQGALLSDQAVGFKIEILEGSVDGNVVYAETHAATTSSFGSVTLTIGRGTSEVGAFDQINWGSQKAFVKISWDATGGTNYEFAGTSELLSVPFAQVAKSLVPEPEKSVLDISNIVTVNETSFCSKNGYYISFDIPNIPYSMIDANTYKVQCKKSGSPIHYEIKNIKWNSGTVEVQYQIEWVESNQLLAVGDELSIEFSYEATNNIVTYNYTTTLVDDACADPEHCGNFIDDNNNSEIDEGCAIHKLWINEIAYDVASGVNADKFVEIGGEAGLDLSGYKLLLIDGGAKTIYETINLTGTVADVNGYGAIDFQTENIKNGNHGLALVSPSNVLIEYISYGGPISITLVGVEYTSFDVGQITDNNFSLQLQSSTVTPLPGSLTFEEDNATRGSLNMNQETGADITNNNWQ